MWDGREESSSKGGGSRDDLDQLHGDSRLSGLIVLKVEFDDDLSCILGGVLHSAHSGALLRGGVVQEGNPQVRGEVELVEGGVACVLIWKLLTIESRKLHSFEESLPGHDFHASDYLRNCRLEFVVVNDDLVVTFGLSLNLVSNGHNSGVVAR